ncbi:hypothetical protein DEJ23_11685 [Curtobacterium sp. MCSS17_008]|uniref:SHOCT domain-containing protein n=1 Tax=Curtobacterium sp. MCSS17_008 TaxID=2175647 RepID=UPI000DA9F786|nr:SHOCT domain-containing protein [Curtobacterium sp. MCSS17_008]PZF55564.1 hypothetical protein DEJ23_11685 [Curtobacterium sp. MCSS17_008]
MAIEDLGALGEETHNPLVPPVYDLVWTLVMVGVIAVLLGIVAIVVVTVLRARRMAARGQNPWTMQEDLAYRAMQSQGLAPTKTLEQRLAELDDLHRRGVISDDEHRGARAEALRA